MRARALAIGLVGLRLASIVGCKSSDDTTAGADTPVAEAKSELTRNLAPDVSPADQAALSSDNRTFALDAYGALAKGDPGANLFFSPYSISSALAMAYAGANGPTATEMATALHFSLPQERLHPAFDQVDLALTNPLPGFTLHVANSMWGATDEIFQQPFLDTLATSYGAGVYREDFAQHPTVAEDQINQWVSDQTNAKITHVLNHDITASTRLVLVDAIYFDADWATAFDPLLTTQSGSFTTPAGPVTAQMMHKYDVSMLAAQTSTYDAIELPYRGSVVMDIVMPKAGTFGAFESTLGSDTLANIVTDLGPMPVNLTLPKFGYEGAPVNLVALLQGFGMNLAFTGAADFSGITTDAIFIGKVLHQAYLRVDEKGTEAAAATAVVFADAAATVIVNPPAVITIDHPFFFTIRDTATDTILFAGRIQDPTK